MKTYRYYPAHRDRYIYDVTPKGSYPGNMYLYCPVIRLMVFSCSEVVDYAIGSIGFKRYITHEYRVVLVPCKVSIFHKKSGTVIRFDEFVKYKSYNKRIPKNYKDHYVKSARERYDLSIELIERERKATGLEFGSAAFLEKIKDFAPEPVLKTKKMKTPRRDVLGMYF